MSDSIFKHSQALDIFNIMFEYNIIASYAGPFDYDVLTLLAENIEKTLWQNKSLGRKFFRIFIELSQNIALYSSDRTTIKGKNFGSGTMIIMDSNDYFIFTAGNVVSKQQKVQLEERANLINSLDRLGLRELKRKYRKRGNEFGSGNIGLIQIALLSKNQLDVKFYPVEDDFYFFLISVKIQKG